MKHIGGYYYSGRTSACRIEEIDASLCSILYYSPVGLNEDGTIEPRHPERDIIDGGYKKFVALKNGNPKLKTILSIAGGRGGIKKYSNLVKDPKLISNFIKSAFHYFREYGFDGVDIDWEYPCAEGGRPEDKKNFVHFLAEVHNELKKYNYLLTVAVGVAISRIEISYDVAGISEHVDFINLMEYDFHSYIFNRTGENAPLTTKNNKNVTDTTDAWIAGGADPQKLVLGTGSYGQTYTLANKNENYIGAPTSGPGLPGPITKSAGILSYGEILEKEKQGWTKVFSTEQQVPYLYKDDQWVGYDDETSILKKMEFAKSRNLVGMMMWSVDMDDPRGLSGIKFPLLKVMNKELEVSWSICNVQ